MAVLIPALQESLYAVTIAMRASGGDPLALADGMRAAVAGLDSDLPVFDVATMEAMVERTYWEKRLYAMLMGTFAGLALLLAAVGLYGVMAYAVAQRTREMGVRMALGARPADLLRLVVGQGMRLTLIGLVLGIGGAYALTQMMASALYGIGPHDPLTFLAVPTTLSLVALLATVIPARRASRVEPLTALRYE
jgi:putative ABC transport system permease protein